MLASQQPAVSSTSPLKILALDTSGAACSVALLARGVVHTRFTLAPRQHNQLILPMLEQVLQAAELELQQLDALAFGCGPGSFTGLRIAAGVVQGLAYAQDLPVIPISTLRALAQQAWRTTGCTRVIAAIDACMNEIYWGAFELSTQQLMQACTLEHVCAPAEFILPAGNWHGAGSGGDSYAHSMRLNSKITWLPNVQVDARDIVELASTAYVAGEMVAAAEALPNYLREQIVKEK